eukprot:4799361-Prymnesium_polylepis.1
MEDRGGGCYLMPDGFSVEGGGEPNEFVVCSCSLKSPVGKPPARALTLAASGRACRWRRPDPEPALAQCAVPLCGAGRAGRLAPDYHDQVRSGDDASDDPGVPLYLLLPRANDHEARVGPAARNARSLRRVIPARCLPHGCAVPTVAQRGVVPLARAPQGLRALWRYRGNGLHRHTRETSHRISLLLIEI